LSPSKQLSLAGWLIALAVGYYLAVRLGLSFRFQNSLIGVVWIANGVLLSALLLTRPSRWGFVYVVTALAHTAAVLPQAPAWRVVWQIGVNAALTITMALMLRRFAGLPLTFATRRQVLIFAAAAFGLPALFSLATPVVVRAMLNLEPDYRFLGTRVSVRSRMRWRRCWSPPCSCSGPSTACTRCNASAGGG
jgi:hypothetical protein